jgi:E3 ubiquitin-protein ligase ZSWIM2
MQRTTAHKKRPGDAWQTSLDALNSTTFYLLARTGPTVFSIKDDTEKVYKISVGNPHGCSCGLHSSENLCIHMMYVLLKVLKVPATHELSYQTSLTDAEITQVLSGSCSTSSSRVAQARLSVAAIRQQREASRRRGSGASSSCGGGGAGDDGKEDNGFVPRQVLDEDEPLQCPICQDDMTKEQALTWCRKGIPRNLHRSQMSPPPTKKLMASPSGRVV